MNYHAPVKLELVDRNNILEWDAFFMDQFKIDSNLLSYDLKGPPKRRPRRHQEIDEGGR